MACGCCATCAGGAGCPPGRRPEPSLRLPDRRTSSRKWSSAMQAFRDAQPLDRTHLKACGAELSKDGKALRVCLANGDFAIADMANSFVLPLKHKGQFILQINFCQWRRHRPRRLRSRRRLRQAFLGERRGEGGDRRQGHHRHAGSRGGDGRDRRHERLHGLRPLPPENRCRASAAFRSRRRVQRPAGTLALVNRTPASVRSRSTS